MKKSSSITINKFYLKTFICLFVSILVGTIFVAIYFTLYRDRYIPPRFDTTAVSGIPEIDEGVYGYSLVNVNDKYNVKICGDPHIEGNNVECYITNLVGNDVLIKGVLYDFDDKLLGESGAISPGEYVKSIKIKTPLPKGEHDVTIKILGFEPETYYSMGTVNLKTTFKVE